MTAPIPTPDRGFHDDLRTPSCAQPCAQPTPEQIPHPPLLLVLRSRDGGQTWQDLSGNLPHAPVNDLAVVGKQLVVATDVGTFSTPNGKPRWVAFGSGMPQLVTTDLRYVPRAKTMFVATFGMGVWSVKV